MILCVCLCVFPLPDVSAVKIQNKLLGKCLQVQTGRVSLAECTPHSAIQEWNWFPEHQALMSQQNGECLTAPAEQYEGVRSQPCIFQAGTDADGAAEEAGGLESQMWSCSKKGHFTLISSGLHLSASSESTLVFLSSEHKHVRVFQPENQNQALDQCDLIFKGLFIPLQTGQQVACT